MPWWVYIVILLLVLFILLLIFWGHFRNKIVKYVGTKGFREVVSRFATKHINTNIVAYCKKYNTMLLPHQHVILENALNKAWRLWTHGKSIKQMIRPIISLAVPYGEYIHDIIENFFVYDPDMKREPEVNDVKQDAKYGMKQNVKQDYKHDVKNASTADDSSLNERLLSIGVKSSCLKLLNNRVKGLILERFNHPDDGICGITLDPISENNKMLNDITIIIRGLEGKTTISFYRKAAIEMWFHGKGQQIDPSTQGRITPNKYLVIS